MTALDVLAVGPAWRARGACVGEPPDWWFPHRGETTSQAVAICASCPVMLQCRQWGIEHEHHGVWGGTSEKERRRLRRVAGIKCTTPEELPDVDDRPTRALWLWRQGWRIDQIADELGTYVKQVHRWLTDSGAAPPHPTADGRAARRRHDEKRRPA